MKSLEMRLQEYGITNEEAKKAILQDGLLKFCDKVQCGIEAGTRYAEKTL